MSIIRNSFARSIAFERRLNEPLSDVTRARIEAFLAGTPRSRFLHICRADRSINSIARICHTPVTIKPNETDLHKSEDAHKCPDLVSARRLRIQIGRAMDFTEASEGPQYQ